MSRRAAYRHPERDWRPFAVEDPNRPVRCVDGLSRPASHCVQLDDGRYVPKRTAAQRAMKEESLSG